MSFYLMYYHLLLPTTTYHFDQKKKKEKKKIPQYPTSRYLLLNGLNSMAEYGVIALMDMDMDGQLMDCDLAVHNKLNI